MIPISIHHSIISVYGSRRSHSNSSILEIVCTVCKCWNFESWMNPRWIVQRKISKRGFSFNWLFSSKQHYYFYSLFNKHIIFRWTIKRGNDDKWQDIAKYYYFHCVTRDHKFITTQFFVIVKIKNSNKVPCAVHRSNGSTYQISIHTLFESGDIRSALCCFMLNLFIWIFNYVVALIECWQQVNNYQPNNKLDTFLFVWNRKELIEDVKIMYIYLNFE